MTPAYTTNLGLKIWSTNIAVQKINGSTLEIFEMVLPSFQIENKLDKIGFFQKIFLLIATSINIVLEIFFLIFSNVNI